jgi:ectoine hydroxylase-related dioxygenase (phytanoyl-CoA dioxygenase family)
MEHEISEQQVDEIIAQIQKVGFCVIPDVLPTPQVEELRSILEAILYLEAGDNKLPSGHQRVLHLALKHEAFLEPLCHPLVLAVWRKYLGKDMICSSWSSNTLWPGCTEIYWHVDHPYWTFEPPYPLALSAHTFFMLDDFTEENGATAAIPGSHARGHLPLLERQWPDDAVLLTGTHGSVIMADGAWWHTSTPNRTQHMRSTLLAKYIRPYCIPQEDMRFQLERLENPGELISYLFGAKQYQSIRGFPY